MIIDVTLPRSGHHMLVNCLASYFSGGLKYTYNNFECPKFFSVNKFVYCEYYGHCKHIPCADKTTTFQKYHDVDGVLKINPKQIYLVQYRHPIDITLSLCEMWSIRNIVEAVNTWAAIWNKFVNKWVFSKLKNVLPIEYNDFLIRPHQYLYKIISLLDKTPINKKLLKHVISQQCLRARRITSSFKNYRDLWETFYAVEQKYRSQLIAANCPLLYEGYYYIENQLTDLFNTIKGNPPWMK